MTAFSKIDFRQNQLTSINVQEFYRLFQQSQNADNTIDSFIFCDIYNPDNSTIDDLSKILPPSFLQACLNGNQNPRVEMHDDVMFILCYGLDDHYQSQINICKNFINCEECKDLKKTKGSDIKSKAMIDFISSDSCLFDKNIEDSKLCIIVSPLFLLIWRKNVFSMPQKILDKLIEIVNLIRNYYLPITVADIKKVLNHNRKKIEQAEEYFSLDDIGPSIYLEKEYSNSQSKEEILQLNIKGIIYECAKCYDDPDREARTSKLKPSDYSLLNVPSDDRSKFNHIFQHFLIETFSLLQDDIKLDVAYRMTLLQEKNKIRPSKILFMLFEEIANSYAILLEAMDKRIEKTELLMFSGKSHKELNLQILNVKKRLVNISRKFKNHNKLIQQISRTNHTVLYDLDIDSYSKDIQDMFEKIDNSVNDYKDQITNMVNLYWAILANATNDIMKTLAIIATIFGLYSVILSFFGANFINLPLVSNPKGWFYACGGMAVMGIIMFIYFKIKKWF